MNLLFWNLHKNSNDELVKEIIEEHDVDIALFAEYVGLNLPELEKKFDGRYKNHDGYNGCEKITLFSKASIDVSVNVEHNRYTIYSIIFEDINYNLAGIHLSAKGSDGDNVERRKDEIRDLVSDICEQEKNNKSSNTLVIGDFNASPFDEELVQKNTFNAVLFKELILDKEYVTYCNKKFRRFYNPMLDYISEDDISYGTYYYSGGDKPLYWYCYDQVIVRKPLVNLVSDIKFCKVIGRTKLISKTKPKETISDHLPLLVHIEGRNINE